MKPVPCAGCKAEIHFVQTRAGKQMPLNAVEVTTTDDRVVLYGLDGEPIKAAGKMRRGYVPHWATCPKATAFRKTTTTTKGATDAARTSEEAEGLEAGSGVGAAAAHREDRAGADR